MELNSLNTLLSLSLVVACAYTRGNTIPSSPLLGYRKSEYNDKANSSVDVVSHTGGNSVSDWVVDNEHVRNVETLTMDSGSTFTVIFDESRKPSDRRLYIRHERAASSPGMQHIKIAALLPADDWRLFSIKRVHPAIDIAIEKVNPILAQYNRSLVVRFRNSNCDIADGINEAINFYVQREVDVFFGPCCDYATATVARQTRYWDIPMVTAGALAGDFGLAKHSVFSALTRVGPNFNSVVNFIVDLLTYYKWKKMRLIYDPQGQMEVINKYCHIAANDIHYGFRTHSETHDFRHWYEKFERNDEILDNMGEFIGRDCAGKACCNPPTHPPVCYCINYSLHYSCK